MAETRPGKYEHVYRSCGELLNMGVGQGTQCSRCQLFVPGEHIGLKEFVQRMEQWQHDTDFLSKACEEKIAIVQTFYFLWEVLCVDDVDETVACICGKLVGHDLRVMDMNKVCV